MKKKANIPTFFQVTETEKHPPACTGVTENGFWSQASMGLKPKSILCDSCACWRVFFCFSDLEEGRDFCLFFPPSGIQNRSMPPTLWFLGHFLLSDSVSRVAGQREASIFFFNTGFAFHRENPFSGSHFLSKA